MEGTVTVHSFDDDLHFVILCKVSVRIMTRSEHLMNLYAFCTMHCNIII